jgi:hypothetical protein
MKILGITTYILLICLISIGCVTEPINSNHIEYTISISSPVSVRVSDSSRIIIKSNIPNYERCSCIWSTENGEIKSAGTEAIYYAPQEKGTATIKVKLYDQQMNPHTDSVQIEIFKQYIILKADDMMFFDRYESGIAPNWIKFIEYISELDIKASIGLIGNSLDKGDSNYLEYLKTIAADEHFEIWNHGYTHEYHEFLGTPYEYQKEHLLLAQNIAKDKLDVTLRAFGAPGDKSDINTAKALDEILEIKVWFYGLDNSDKLNLKFYTHIEFPCHNPDYEEFLEEYKPERECLVLEIHPNSWYNWYKWRNFEKIIDYLISCDVTFTLPYYYLLDFQIL